MVFLPPDAGEIEVAGVPVALRSAQDSLHLGIGMVHQDLQLLEPLSVAENLFFGLRPPVAWNHTKLLDSETRRVLEAGGLSHIDPGAAVEDLPMGARQQIEILKVLMRGAKILILDEPTSSLTPMEVEGLFDTLRRMKAVTRLSIILITHKLKEVLALCDRVTVLRDGKTVSVFDRDDLTADKLALAVTGDHVVPAEVESSPRIQTKGPVLSIRGLFMRDSHGHLRVEDASLDVGAGEIVAVAGISGNGQTELVLGLLGHQRVEAGDVFLDGTSITDEKVGAIRDLGVAIVPEDRDREGLLLGMSIRDNVLVGHAYRVTHPPLRLLRYSRLQDWIRRLMVRFDVRAPSAMTLTQELSGGNRQKVLVARELSNSAKLIIASEPTRGLDITAAAQTRSLLVTAAHNEGAGVLLLSSDLDEVREVADRVAVMYRGRLTPSYPVEEVGRSKLGALMGGVNWPDTADD